jgi:hypothetical protein
MNRVDDELFGPPINLANQVYDPLAIDLIATSKFFTEEISR